MTTTLMILQAVVSVLLIITVLLQFGKGAEAGLLGGSSDSVFTGAQQANIFSKITIVLSVVFLANSVLLAKIQGDKSSRSLLESEALSTNPLQAPKGEEAGADDKKGVEEPSKKSKTTDESGKKSRTRRESKTPKQ